MKKLYYIFAFLLMTFIGNNFNAQTTSTEEVLIAYPNPTRNSLFLKTNVSTVSIKSVTFYTILGRAVINYTINSNSTKINIESLKRGKYLMKYTLSDNRSSVKQIIKQ